MYFLENVLAYCKTNDLSEAAFEKGAGLSKGQINKWKKGTVPRISSMQKSADFIGIKLVDLMNNVLFGEGTTVEFDGVNTKDGQTSLNIPIVNLKRKTDEEVGSDACIDLDSILLNSVISSPDCFAMIIYDNSMEPAIRMYDIVIADKSTVAKSGDIVTVSTPGDDVLCRKLVYTENGIILQPVNPEYAPVYYSNLEIEDLPVAITGRVIGLIRTYN